MLSLVARLRLSILSTLSLIVLARHASAAGSTTSSVTNSDKDILFTSSVSYCEPPEVVLVQQFDVMYFAANQSIFFNISAASVDAVNVTASLLVNVYGIQPINLTIDLCTILGGALCPLPTYNFQGSQTLQLPDSVDISSRVPGIAYKIPDLEAFAQLTLTSIDTGDIKACVQSTLSNGWSMRQLAVQWATGGLALSFLLTALLHTGLRSGDPRAPARLIDYLSLLQTIVSTALLDLNYPVVYRAFASNFSWAFGLFSSPDDSNIQNAIDNMRHITGGKMSDAAGGDGVELVNRKLSPYNVISSVSDLTRVAVKALQKKVAAMQSVSNSGSANLFMKRDTTVTVTSSNVLDAGIPVYVNSLGIGTANAFMSAFFTLLMLSAIAITLIALGWALINILLRSKQKSGKGEGKVEEWKEYYPRFSFGWTHRLILIVFFPISILSLHQWTLKDSWLSILLSVITFLAICSALVFFSFRIFFLSKHEGPETLYNNPKHLISLGVSYDTLRIPRYYYFVLPLLLLLTKSLVIAFGSSNGLAQLIVIIILEIGFLVTTVIFRPYQTRGGDVLSNTLASGRILATGLSFAFVERFNIGAIPRVAVGIVIALIFSLCVVMMFFNLLTNLGLRSLWREHIKRRLGVRLGSNMFLGASKEGKRGTSDRSHDLDSSEGGSVKNEKVLVDEYTSQSQSKLGNFERPRNPTPQQNVPLDPSLNEPYPEVTPTSAGHFSVFRPESYASSRMPSTGTTLDSFGPSSIGSSTLGTELPRRASYVGLGLDRIDLEEGGYPSPSRSTSIPSTPSSNQSHGYNRAASRRESWTPSAALHKMSESREQADDVQRIPMAV